MKYLKQVEDGLSKKMTDPIHIRRLKGPMASASRECQHFLALGPALSKGAPAAAAPKPKRPMTARERKRAKRKLKMAPKVVKSGEAVACSKKVPSLQKRIDELIAQELKTRKPPKGKKRNAKLEAALKTAYARGDSNAIVIGVRGDKAPVNFVKGVLPAKQTGAYVIYRVKGRKAPACLYGYITFEKVKTGRRWSKWQYAGRSGTEKIYCANAKK